MSVFIPAFRKRRRNGRQRQGFTIIEVMIVLAIAGLVMLIVFIAVPHLQRNSRDYQRKTYAQQFFAAVQEFYANNRRYPDPLSATDVDRFVRNYAPKFEDPSTGHPYTLTTIDPSIGAEDTIEYRADTASHSDIPPVGKIYIQFAHWCNTHGAYGGHVPPPDDPIASDGGADTLRSKFVVWIGLESSGRYYCIDNF